MSKSKEEIELVATQLVDSMLAVHRELGPGLLESTYQACLAYELRDRGIEVRCEVELPVKFKGLEIEAGYRDRHAGGRLHRDRKQVGSSLGSNP